MIKAEKVAAVRKYLMLEFPDFQIRDYYESGRMAQCFEIGSERTRFKTIVSEEFLKDHDENEIPVMLKRFLLVEHLRECDLPIIVTNEGLQV